MNTVHPKVITATALKTNTGDILRQVGVDGEHLIIERGQFPIAVLLPVADYKALLAAQQQAVPVRPASVSAKAHTG